MISGRSPRPKGFALRYSLATHEVGCWGRYLEGGFTLKSVRLPKVVVRILSCSRYTRTLGYCVDVGSNKN